MPGPSAISFFSISGSRFSSAIWTVKGTIQIRRQIPSSVPRITGSWLVVSQIFAVGVNSNSFS